MFDDALRSLHPSETTVIAVQLRTWRESSSAQWSRIAANIEAETGFPEAVFKGMLAVFASHLQAGDLAPEDCWTTACRAHQFRGRAMLPPIPERVGRAAPLSHYAKLVSSSISTGLSDEQVENLIRKVVLAGQTPTPREFRILRSALLGRYVIWATFNEAHPAENPFDHLPQTIEAVRTALGLGECPITETLVLLSYGTELPAPEVIQLHRPTVCDADRYSWFHPHPDPASVCGRTQPLDPNPDGYSGQPEVVHREISGATLFPPLYLTR